MKYLLLLCLLIITSFSSVALAKIYKGAEYRTRESFLYGRFEASLKSSGKEGTLSTMFTYFDGLPNDEWATTKWNEIDIEILNRYNNDVQLNTITPSQTSHVRHQYINFNPHVDFHTYAIEWTPDYVAWFIDGIEVYKQTDSFVKTLIHPQKFMFNVWIPEGSNWVGVFISDLLPAFTTYDWASYSAYTPGKGNYGSSKNFTKEWQDDFDTYDSTRWEKATHTFGGNLVDFIPENIVFKDGKMFLSITTPTEIGYTDKKAPTIISTRAVSENTVRLKFSELLEKNSAEVATRYLISGATIKSTSMLDDMQTVELKVENLNYEAPPNVIVLAGIKDLFSPANTSGMISRLIYPNIKFSFPLKINIGGENIGEYIADKEFKTDTSYYGFMEGRKVNYANTPIVNTEVDEVFQSEVNGLAKYIIPLPNGKYNVTLQFAENALVAEGKRVFDVYVQGKKLIEALDVFKKVGNNTACQIVLDNVVVADYLMDIHFSAITNYPILNGLIIEKVGTGVDNHSSIPNEFWIGQNFPNPFNPETTINYNLPNDENVCLKIYNSLGAEIATIINEFKHAGAHKIKLNASDFNLASGVYFYMISTSSNATVKKMLLLK